VRRLPQVRPVGGQGPSCGIGSLYVGARHACGTSRGAVGPLRETESRLDAAIRSAGAGEYDGDEVATDLSDGLLYMYGPDADRLYAAIRPVLESAAFMRGATVHVRYGPPGSHENVIIVGN
jgi:hypothetical protein